ncbi:hypothetical protein ACB092_04G029200 [Castanea dentata]
MAHEINSLRLLLGSYSFSASSTTNGAFSSLMIQHKPRVERFFRIIAVASILFALVIVLYATALLLR